MGEVVDFQQFKDKKVVEQIEFIPPKHESYCPFCQAPTTVIKTIAGTDIHTFDPTNMEAYNKLKKLVIEIVNYFKTTDDGVEDADLIEAFGQGMAEFLRELNQGQKERG